MNLKVIPDNPPNPFHCLWILLFASLITSSISTESGSKIGRCPQLIDSNPSYCKANISSECSSDNHCEDIKKCCPDGCINVCIEPRLSACEHKRLSLEKQMNLLVNEESSITLPECKPDGEFEPVQCDSKLEECWCIDNRGFEIAGTRSSSNESINCNAPNLCSGLMCRMLCPYDFELDEKGCPLCQCRDPCSGIKCPGNQECHLEDVECDNEPCPPVPSCKQARILETVCPNGEPLFLSEKNQPFLCGMSENQPQCPPFFECVVQNGMDYGSCCPTFESLDKPGKCPSLHSQTECGDNCNTDADCIGLLKCCQSELCGFHCVSSNSTRCEQQRMLAELMSRNEKEDRGYIPECTEIGEFKTKQCSRNALVCWCVNRKGEKIPQTMGPAETVVCSEKNEIATSSSFCDDIICNVFCEYGFKQDANGCQSCDCSEPCDGFNCPEGTSCVVKQSKSCIESFCQSVPACEAVKQMPFACPPAENLGCLNETLCINDEDCQKDSKCCSHSCGTSCIILTFPSNRLPTMCEYIRMYALAIIDSPMAQMLAFPVPKCTNDGLYEPVQCNKNECWCVDDYGVELKKSRVLSQDTIDCSHAQSQNNCSGLMCRLGCDYGFKKDENGCSLCECRNPCDDIECQDGKACQLVENEILCTGGFCPPVPQCLHKSKSSSLSCPYGSPLWNLSANSNWNCGIDGLECPNTHMCKKDVDSIGICCLKTVDDLCVAPKQVGECLETIEQWYFNNDTGHCEYLIYTGCKDDRGFTSKELCEVTCTINRETIPKNGTCPEVLPDEMGTCASECQNDIECPGPQKCCMNGCEAYICRDPLGSNGKSGQCPFLISMAARSCDFQCKSDYDCSGNLKCCSNGCGTVCTEPEMKTSCEHQKAIAEYKIREERLPSGLIFVPKCQENGKFYEVQCSIVNQNCWCVDENGVEISGTHTYNSTPPNCGNPAKCSALNCKINCEHGYDLDSTGCPVCQCHNPCSDLICNENEECRMAQVQCITSPCPPIPICLPKIDNPCPHGEPYHDLISKNIIKCGPHGTQCPSTHQCHLSPLGEYAVCCPKSHDICFQSSDPGLCLAMIPRWHFDPNDNACVEFQYGGCGGNLNNFQTKEDCERVCPVLSDCEQVRENNLKLGRNFLPNCNAQTKLWESVQCIDSVGICWCVNVQGEEILGSRVRGHPQCSSRAGRKFGISEQLKICDHDIVHVCDPSACNNKICLAYPDAVCHIDPCGGCTLRFYNFSGNLVDCTEGFGPCQMELQQALNSQSWSNEYTAAFLPKEEDLLVPLPQFVSSESSSKLSINKRDLLGNTLSFLKSLMQGVSQDTAKESSEFSPLSLLDELPSERFMNLPLEMGVVLPVCMSTGEYSPLQSYKSLRWCSTPTGIPVHESLTQGYLECSSNGSILQRESKPFCANGLKPATVCKNECMNAECPAHPNTVCSADPCNNCKITFTNAEGRSVNCQDKCLQPIEVGMCRASFRNWFYNQTSGECEEFIFGGCLGNDNNFESYESCFGECKQPIDICRLPKQIGMCRASMHRWYFNHLTKRCEEFIYGGCDQNQNNFETQEECEAVCPDLVLCNELSKDKVLKACSRRETCRRQTCSGHEDVVCTVDACDNCSPVFVDLDGIRVDCNKSSDGIINHIPTLVTETYNTSTDKDTFVVHMKKKTRCQKQRMWAVLHGGHVPDCDFHGRFEPTQCDERNVEELQPFCWCVDEAGNQVQGTVHFIKGSYECKHTKILKIEVSLVFSQPSDNPLLPNTSVVKKAIEKLISNSEPKHNLNVTVLNRSDAIVVKFVLDDPDKVDIAYTLEEQIKYGHLTLDIDGYTLYAIHSASTFRHVVVEEETFNIDQPLSSASVAIIIILCLLTVILISVLIVGVSVYRRKRIGIYPKGSLESLASSTTPLNVYDSKTSLDMSSPLLYNLKNEKNGLKMAISSVEHEYAVISPTLYPSKDVVT